MTTLLLSQRRTDDTQALWRAAIQRGWSVQRLRYGLTLEVDDDAVIYMGPLFALPTAKALGVTLLDPDENWLPRLPWEHRKRSIRKTTLGEVKLPAFVKPPNDKSFEARVYNPGDKLDHVLQTETVLESEIVEWESEYRCFALNGKVLTASPYTDFNPLDFLAVQEFAEEVLANTPTPKAIVLDVGKIVGQGWAVVEANGAWGSGIYGCDPDSVLDVIQHATEN